MAVLADSSRVAFRGYVWDDPAFPAFFRRFTPIDEFALLAMRTDRAAAGRRRACRPSRAPETLLLPRARWTL